MDYLTLNHITFDPELGSFVAYAYRDKWIPNPHGGSSWKERTWIKRKLSPKVVNMLLVYDHTYLQPVGYVLPEPRNFTCGCC